MGTSSASEMRSASSGVQEVLCPLARWPIIDLEQSEYRARRDIENPRRSIVALSISGELSRIQVPFGYRFNLTTILIGRRADVNVMRAILLRRVDACQEMTWL